METPFNKCAYSIAVVLIWLCIVSSHKIIYDELLSDVQTIGRACRFQRNDTSGVCRELSDCSQVYAELTELNVAPTTCWFDHDAPVVCCYVAPGLRGELQLDRRSSDKCLNVYSKLEVKEEDKVFKTAVVGGKMTNRGEFPHMVGIGWTDTASKQIEWNCGGSLISEEYVLTAAHCITSTKGRPDIVRLGETELTGIANDHIPEDFIIANIVVHPAYRRRKYYNDIALLRLNGRITISSWVRPACLWQTEAINATNAIVTGYGLTEFGGKPSTGLLKADLTLVENSACSTGYAGDTNLADGILPSQICAGDEKGERDTCQGDSGGPLQIATWVNFQKLYHIVGITSFGRGCATTHPGVYTRVSYYLDWIESVVWP